VPGGKGGKGSRRSTSNVQSGPTTNLSVHHSSDLNFTTGFVATSAGFLCRFYGATGSHYLFGSGVLFHKAMVDTLLTSLGIDPSAVNMSFLFSPYSDTSSALKFISIVGTCYNKLVRLPCPDWFISRKVLPCLVDTYATSDPSLVSAYHAGSEPDFR
jgi:hypothetical protein